MNSIVDVIVTCAVNLVKIEVIISDVLVEGTGTHVAELIYETIVVVQSSHLVN